MSQITIGGTTLNFKDSAFTGDQWEQVASWVLNGGAEGIDANAQIATEKAAAASASAAAARNSATSAGESATAAANSATAAKASEDSSAGSAENAAASATSAANSAANASDSATASATSAQTAQSAASTATGAASMASTAAEEASGSASQAQESAADAAKSAASVDGINKTAQSWAVGGTGTRDGEDTNNAKYWAEQAQQAVDGALSMVITEIPKGRMRGDIKGTGKVGTSTDLTSSQYYNTNTDQANPDSWACDVDGNGYINSSDVTAIIDGKLYSTPFLDDYYSNWTYHKVDNTSGYWTTELSIPAITAEMGVSIVCGGSVLAGTFIKAEPFAGGIRIHANYPPIEALPCEISYATGVGGRIIIANTGVSDTYVQDAVSSAGAKYVRVKLTAAGWGGGKEQIVSVPGLDISAAEQLIIPTQPSKSIEKYYNAGIRISARDDSKLTFSCETIPTEDITVILVIIPIIGTFEG